MNASAIKSSVSGTHDKKLNVRNLYYTVSSCFTLLRQTYVILYIPIVDIRTLKLRQVICADSQTLGFESVKLPNHTFSLFCIWCTLKCNSVRGLQNENSGWLQSEGAGRGCYVCMNPVECLFEYTQSSGIIDRADIVL